MPSDDSKNYFNSFKVSKLMGDPQLGNLQEYSLDELKNGIPTENPWSPEREQVNSRQVFYADGSDAFANMGFVVSFLHVPSDSYVHFKAFINAFNESFSSDWSSESVYGRTDPIKMFKQTTRSITLSLIVPAASEGEGFENLGKVQQLLSFLYPTYENADNALTISQSPLIRMRIMNLIRKTRYAFDVGSEYDELFKEYFGTTKPETSGLFASHKQQMQTLSSQGAQQGLLGHIRNLSVNHNLENVELGSFHSAPGVIIPKAVEVTLDFDVIHERVLGWEQNSTGGQDFTDQLFPYGVDVEGSGPVGSKEQMEAKMAEAAASAVQGQIENLEQEAAQAKSEQMIQNAIAAGHLVASGVVDGQIQYDLTARGQRKLNRHTERLNAKEDNNPFNRKPYPMETALDEALYSDALAYGNTLKDFVK